MFDLVVMQPFTRRLNDAGALRVYKVGERIAAGPEADKIRQAHGLSVVPVPAETKSEPDAAPKAKPAPAAS